MSRIYNTTRWQLTRRVILKRDNYRCHWCGERATQVDHVKALVMGGQPYDPVNLVAACRECNAKRGRATQTGGTVTRPVLEPIRVGAIRV